MSYTLLILTLLCQLALAIPTSNQDDRLTIPLIRRDRQTHTLVTMQQQLNYTLSKYAQGFRAYHRNTGMRHPLDTAQYRSYTHEKRGFSTLWISQDPFKSLWQGIVSVGTPPHQFSVDFDTGSSDIYLPGVGCTQNCQGHRLYDPSASRTSRDYNQTFEFAYGDGTSILGEVYTDILSISDLVAKSQVIGVASSYSNNARVDQFYPDGLVGLAWPSISDFYAPPVIQNMVAGGSISDPVFAFEFKGSDGYFHIGRASKASPTHTALTYTPVTEQGFWQVGLDAVSVASKVVSQSQTAVVDTGTTGIIGPTAAVDAFYAAIPMSKKLGNGFYTLPCSSMPEDVTFTFAGLPLTVSDTLFNLGPVGMKTDRCFGGIMGEDDIDFWIVGDMFLQGVYTEFDFANSRVGFAATI